MKRVIFVDASPLNHNDKIKEHYLLVIELTSMQDASQKCHYAES